MLSQELQSKGLESPGEVCGICYSQWCGWGGMENLIVGEFLWGVVVYLWWPCWCKNFHNLKLLPSSAHYSHT
jgi:hypothetical protein